MPQSRPPKKIKNSAGEVVLHKSKQWSDFRVDLVRRKGLQRQEFEVSGDRHSIFLNLEGAAKSGENFLDGSRVDFVARPEGAITYLPPGRIWRGWDDGDPVATYLFISAEDRFARERFRDFHPGKLRPELGFTDSDIELSARKIATELSSVDDATSLIVEGQLTSIFGHLLRRSKTTAVRARGGLAPSMLKAAMKKIDGSLGEQLSLAAVAHDLGISTAYLSRAFKQSTGMSPHAYFNTRRLEYARQLLRTTSLSVTEIALLCGYASGSHLSTSFRQKLAVPPTTYRNRWTK